MIQAFETTPAMTTDSSATTTTIRVAHSPDADDAFMFWALAKNKIDTGNLRFEHVLCDIETLNREALNCTYELTAISYHAYAHIADKYALLSTGSSVGDRYGPVLVARDALSQEALRKGRVAIPGEWTTAYLALKLWDNELNTVQVPFDEIQPRVKAGEFEAGLIIHEGQLTYRQEGLTKIVDLGEWWFDDTNLPLPLGGNAIRKDLSPEMMQDIGRLLKESVAYGLEHMDEALDYAMGFGRGLERSQVRRFVDMYVNRMTLASDSEIRKAVKLLLWRGQGIGLIPTKIEPEFIDVV